MTPLPQHVADALAPREPLTVSEWADRHRFLDPKTCAEPGPWRTSRTPYLRAVMDAINNRDIEEITFVKSTQVGGTECEFNTLGWIVDMQPGPTMLVYPDIGLARKISAARIRPMFNLSPALRRHKPDVGDSMTMLTYRLDSMDVYLVGAGSAGALSSFPIRYLLFDECDKYPPFSGREADPINLARERLKTFLRSRKARVMKASTPTVPSGYISVEWDAAWQHEYYVPCPHCGKRFVFEFGPDSMKWPTGSTADEVKSQRLAWYECPHCSDRIEDRHKRKMLEDGEWIGKGPPTSHIGFRINAIYSPWLTFSDVAAEFLSSKDDRAALMNFWNSWLAKPFEETVSALHEGQLAKLAAEARYPRGEVPKETMLLTAGVDWHGRTKGLYWSVWAWAEDRRCWLVDYGQEFSVEDLDSILVDRPWATPEGDNLTLLVGVDSGWEAPEVYAYCRSHGHPRFRPTKGQQRLEVPVRPWAIDYKGGRKKRSWNLTGLHVHTEFFKDTLASQLAMVDQREGLDDAACPLQFCQGVEQRFLRHLQSEHKIKERNNKMVWKPKYASAPNHWLDTTIIAHAIAEHAGASRLKRLIRRAMPGKVPEASRFKGNEGYRRH